VPDLPIPPAVREGSLESFLRRPVIDKLFGAVLVLVHEQKVFALIHASLFDLASIAYTINFLVLGALILFRRPARRMDMTPLAWFCGVAASALGIGLNFVHFGGEHRLGPRAVSQTLAIVGMGLMTVSRLSLGRSFGLLPADRGIKTRGAYRLVRHPIYSAFLFSLAAVLLSRFSLGLVAMAAGTMALLMVRIGQEERLLLGNPVYQAYAGRVGSRLVPFIY
jgi:protein-S-isoprenylcysteine O-methyltransferase Ste14